MAPRVEITNRIPQVAAELDGELARLIKDATHDTWSEARRDAPVDTGELRDGYQEEFSADGRTGTVWNDVKHGPYVELGTRRSRAQPHLLPAFEEASDQVDRELRALARRLER